MSHKYRQNKRNLNEYSDSSDSEKCGRDQCYNQYSACIVCPPCNYREKYDSSESDSSCPDFSDLCEDKPRICIEKKYYNNESFESSESSDSSDSSDSEDERCRKNIYNKCHGCEKACSKCNKCRACGCRECSDFSHSSVMKSLDLSESESECANFSHLASNTKDKKCLPLYSYRKQDNKVKKEQDKPKQKKQTSALSSSGASSASKGKKFVVSFGPKAGHQWAEYNEGEESIYINGKNGPVLHLYRGCTYFFVVEQKEVTDESSDDSKHFFVLTNSPVGGSTARVINGGFAPISKGCVCFKVDKHTPRYFYYQSSKQTFEGGLIIVHDK